MGSTIGCAIERHTTLLARQTQRQPRPSPLFFGPVGRASVAESRGQSGVMIADSPAGRAFCNVRGGGAAWAGSTPRHEDLVRCRPAPVRIGADGLGGFSDDA